MCEITKVTEYTVKLTGRELVLIMDGLLHIAGVSGSIFPTESTRERAKHLRQELSNAKEVTGG